VGTRSLSSGPPKAGPVGFAHPTTVHAALLHPLKINEKFRNGHAPGRQLLLERRVLQGLYGG
jgi:hypothetical protein